MITACTPSPKVLSAGIIGVGHVGGELLSQLGGDLAHLKQRFNLDLRVRAVCNSRQMILAEETLDLAGAPAALKDGEPTDLVRFQAHVQDGRLPHAVIIDCTASEEVASRHAAWLAAGIHLVTPNKKAMAAPLEAYRALQTARGQGGAGRYLYSTTVGAGLPMIQTLRDLCQTGHTVQVMEGLLSGTFTWLFKQLDGSRPFSELVRTAWRQGRTEPDPREDLCGMDVARKVVILAREMGMELEVADLEIGSLVPESLGQCSVEAFLDGIDALDGEMAFRFERARQGHRVLRFVGRLTRKGPASVGLIELPKDHPFAHTELGEHAVRFFTHRYSESPLELRGPGGGPVITAAGIVADLLRLGAVL